MSRALDDKKQKAYPFEGVYDKCSIGNKLTAIVVVFNFVPELKATAESNL
jgi:hypothetical protein